MKITGKVNSFQSLGAVDGPGVRFVAFLQGCPLKCVCCHNPETQSPIGGEEYSAEEIILKAERYKEYFGKEGGITLSGGEPLMQPEFVTAIFKECRKRGIHTCLDTSGYRLDSKVKEVLKFADLVLLDIKYTDRESYLNYAGCEMDSALKFLEYLDHNGIPTWIRQVIIPGLNDNEENIKALKQIIMRHTCIEKTELLPFKKICEMKYEKMGLVFSLKDTPEPTSDKMKELEELLFD